MDSGNSGSMQSSSGGDEEFHSRGTESISSFLNPPSHNNNNNFNTLTTQNQQFLTHNQNQTFFNPQTLDHNPFPQPNLATHHNNSTNDTLIWSSGLRSGPNYSNFANITPSASSMPPRTQPISSTQGPFSGPSPSVPLRTEPEAHTFRAASDQLSNVIKNPKKRTRASRRAPTTVLTTDTTNFRQMVQEFTGIPSVPFSGSPYSRRLDLFSAASALRPGSNLDSLGPLYPLRPAAHKFTPPFANSSNSSQSLLNSAMLDSMNNNTIGGSTWNNQNFDHLLNLEQHQNISLQNFGNLMGGFPSEETRSDSAQVRNNNNNDGNVRRWRSGETGRNSNNNDGVEENNMVQFDGNVNSAGESVQQHVSGYNLNVSEKGLENVVVSASAGADQGNVASWICPSD